MGKVTGKVRSSVSDLLLVCVQQNLGRWNFIGRHVEIPAHWQMLGGVDGSSIKRETEVRTRKIAGEARILLHFLLFYDKCVHLAEREVN
jgi:hypothetical protein